MVLYLSAEQPANVTVRVNGTSWVRNYSIPANTVQVSDPLPKTGADDARLTTEGLFNRGIEITSDVPIVAYAHIYASLSSGAGLLLPTGTYGYEYRALGTAQAYPGTSGSCHSWFLVIADEDNTVVEITPAAPTAGGKPANVPFTVNMNKGDVYQVLGAMINADQGHDLTGSLVRSIPNSNGVCKPIAVFTGSSRTALCNEFGGDNLIQQVWPSTAWGSRYLTVPTVSTTNTASFNANIYRVAVKDPATVVKRNGVQLTGLVNNYYYEFISTTPDLIEADQPVMVAQIMPSQGAQAAVCPGVSYSGLVDPELIYISPIEQAIKKIVFYSTPNAAVSNHYVNIIIPTSGVASLTIDGSNVFDVNVPHPQLAGYSYIVKKLTSGQHIAQSNEPFTAIAYGAASEESYGYNAGTLVKNLSAVSAITNIHNQTGTTNDYTCVRTPFRFSILIPVQPTSILWEFSKVFSLDPGADVLQTDPVPVGTEVIGGRTFYRFEVAQDYIFNVVGTYTVPIYITHPNIEGCDNKMYHELKVNVIPAPTADFTTTFNGCVDDIATFNASGTTSNGVPIATYNWVFHDATTANTQTTTKQFPAPGTFNVRMYLLAQDGCLGEVEKPIDVNQGPPPIMVSDSVAVCAGADATLTIQDIPGIVYDWYTSETGGTAFHTGTSYTVTNVTSTQYFYIESLQNGCPSAMRKRVVVQVLPTLANPVLALGTVTSNSITWTWNAVPQAIGYEVSTDNGATWSAPSSGSSGLSHTVGNLQPGDELTLIVRALGGCLPAESNAVTGKTGADNVFIPNTFTPNNDGMNDVFTVYGSNIKEIRLMVYNQWGEKVFETRNQAVGWDGTYQGKKQPSGVYMYVCRLILTDNTEKTMKGSINLLR